MAPAVSLRHLPKEALYGADRNGILEATHPMIPLDAPGMPPAGVNFIAHAIDLGDDPEIADYKKKKIAQPVTAMITALYRSALYDPDFTMPIRVKGEILPVSFLPGHLIRHGLSKTEKTFGPKKARVMIVGKMPGNSNIEEKNALSGAGMEPLRAALGLTGFKAEDVLDFYVTAACKFAQPTKDGTTLPAAWVKDCAILLEQEIRLVEPDFILCLGAEATKAVLQTKSSVSALAGRSVEMSVVSADGKPREITVMSVMHPAYIARKPELEEDFQTQIARFKELLDGASAEKEVVDHADVYTEDALREIVDEMISGPHPHANIIAIDCEWHGDHPTEPGSYLRTVQISNKDRWARTIVLRHQGGGDAFYPNLDAARQQLIRLLKSTATREVRVGGHFFRADLPWLIDFGVDVRPEYAPATSPENRSSGGWDTSLMYHAVNECTKYGLDICSLRFTSAPTYWDELNRWIKDYCAANKLKSGDVGGYGNCPADVLHPYASYDVDVTRRIMLYFYGTDGTDGALASDNFGNDCWLPYWIAHSASLGFLEMEMTGLVLDRQRADMLTTLFMNTQDKLLEDLRRELNWPSFNPKSQPQLAIALFGLSFADRYTNSPAVPDAAKLLNLPPVKTTGKRPVLWSEMSYRGVNPEKATPSTDKESLGILGHKNETAAKIRDYKFISQVLQSVLRKPNLNEDGEFELDENGHFSYDKGLVGCAHADGRVRTHFFQTKETGRASSSRPPLQNLSSRRETDYKRILGKQQYRHPVRSILRVPKGYVGMETDLTGAELAVLAWLSQDPNMIDHTRRNNLPESHPDHYDMHSQQAVKTFRITDCPPTKTGLEGAGKKGLRVAAKNVNFGIPYGRGSEALARQCKEEGHDVTAAQCQAMIDSYFDAYPLTKDFLADCRARSQDPGWLVGPYGRIRRFVPAKERSVRAEQERQAQNFPIQGAVADAVSLAINNFYRFREATADIDYKIVMQIHDAVVLLVPFEHAARVYSEVIPRCMTEGVPFHPRYLDGRPINAGPYYFGSSREVFVHWGEVLNAEQVGDLGLHDLAEKMAE
jgi:uracil-DNA glycosylase family 4